MITTRPAEGRVQVTYKGEIIADSRDALTLHEGSYAPVYYFPRKDVKMEQLQPSTHRTRCPHKGEASYFSLRGGPANAVWSYEQPIEGVKQIAGLLAFYPDKVDSIAAVAA